MTIELAREGFRAAPTEEERVFEAAKLFGEGRNPANFSRQNTLMEAFTTSDFPKLLGAAFEKEAMGAQKDAVKEYDLFAFQKNLSDFRPKKMVDLFGNEYFEDVAQGEEYKGDKLAETDVEIKTGKTGKTFGLTWELQLSRDFSDLADFPKVLGNAAVNTENRKIYEVLVGSTGLKTSFFGTVDTKPLTSENMIAAIETMSLTENHRKELVDLSSIVLVVGPGLAMRARQILNAEKIIRKVDDGAGNVTETEETNPFRGLVQLQVSREFVNLNNAATKNTSWALLPGKATANPAVVKTGLIGHENVDIRVKRDQGERVGGGAVPVNDGSFNDDTIWFRGRHVTGGAKGFTVAVYGSKGA
ncbi:putative major capsid protein [Glutamicibacter phage BIM BV-113]|nr:putative major capsid protein [Glutamicibacter phage BIM BV-113]